MNEAQDPEEFDPFALGGYSEEDAQAESVQTSFEKLLAAPIPAGVAISKPARRDQFATTAGHSLACSPADRREHGVTDEEIRSFSQERMPSHLFKVVMEAMERRRALIQEETEKEAARKRLIEGL